MLRALAALLAGGAVALAASTDTPADTPIGAPAGPPAVELAGFAVLPADSFGPGPPSGQYDGDGRRAERPRFAAQPVLGLSAVQRGPTPDTWWGLSDNGYGARWNSFDFRLAIHLFAARPSSREVRVLRRIELRDPQRRFPWRLTEESLPERPLTGADVDPESLLAMPDGSFWIGDEIGPWLLHFSADGVLLAPPVELPVELPGDGAGDNGLLLSESHPRVLAGRASARVRASKGFESLARMTRPDGTAMLLALLEGTVDGDPPGVLRLAEFDPAAGRWSGRTWRYRMQDPANAVAELAIATPDATAATTRYLLIERDDLHGDAARFKQVRAIVLDASGVDGVLQSRLVVDLLRIPDPRGHGAMGPLFRFPFWTPEALLLVDARTLMVVADNNFPASGGRSATNPDPTEWIWIRARGRAGFVGTR